MRRCFFLGSRGSSEEDKSRQGSFSRAETCCLGAEQEGEKVQ